MVHQRLPYTTDLTDDEWQVLAPAAARSSGGRPRKYPRREVVNGIQYGLGAGCAWRLMPYDLPHWQTAYQRLRVRRQDGVRHGQAVARRLLVSPLMNKDFPGCYLTLAHGNLVSANLNHHKCARPEM